MGIGHTAQWISVDPDHPHDQPHRQPLEAVDGLMMGPLALLILGYASLGYVKRAGQASSSKERRRPNAPTSPPAPGSVRGV